MSSNDSPGMKRDTARRTNGAFDARSRSHVLSDPLINTLRMTDMEGFYWFKGSQVQGFTGSFLRLQRMQRTDAAEIGPQPAYDYNHEDCRNATTDDGDRGAEERRRGSALEGAELVREADEHVVDRRHAAAQVVWRDRLFEGQADHDTEVVEHTSEIEARQRQGEPS